MARFWKAAAIALIVLGCSRAPRYAQPPATEYTVAKLELAGDPLDTVQGAAITEEFFRASGVSALLGRLLTQYDFRSAGQPTAVISNDLWRRRFASDVAIIGKPIRLNGADAIVVGVLPEDADFPKGTSVWIPRR